MQKPGLEQEQAALVAWIWGQPGAEPPAQLRAPGAHALPAGLSAYREHAKALAVRALAAVYPRLQRWLGEAEFAGLAWAFARQRPPRQGDMNRWGLDLDEFLLALPGMDEEPPALAHLEAQLHRLGFAADDAAQDPALWQRLQQQDPARLRLVLSPLLGLSSLPLSLQAQLEGEGGAQPSAGDVLVWACRLEALLGLAWRRPGGVAAGLQATAELCRRARRGAASLSRARPRRRTEPGLAAGLAARCRDAGRVRSAALARLRLIHRYESTMRLPTALRAMLAAATDAGVPPDRMPQPLRAPLFGLQQALLLAARLYVAKVFFWSGLTKLRDWEITVALFQDEYQVPLLPPEVAAMAGTAGELLLPALLALGLGGRFAAAGLFVLNIVAVLSLAEVAPAALLLHQLWGALLLLVWIWGPGAISLDRLFTRSAGTR